jgi:hypothetical protein
MPFINPFDDVMNSTCTIYKKGTGSANSYNQPNQTLQAVLSNWPCRLSQMGMGGGRGNKYMKGKEYAVRMYLLFMRPPTQDDNNNIPFTLNEHYWAIVTTPGDGPELKLNIHSVQDPSGIGHHLECICEMVIP